MMSKDKPTDDAMRFAIGSRDAARVRDLVAAGADLTTIDAEGLTPLMLAAKLQMPEVVEVLLEAGADTQVKDRKGYTAEMLARWYGEYANGAWTAESDRLVEMIRHAKS